MSETVIHDERACKLGEGPLWHPQAKRLFWFDILGNTLMCDDGRDWRFEANVSAAGWVSGTSFLIASETELFLFDIETRAREHVAALEADNPATRSNDGRADPWGGMWIGTMGKNAEAGAGAIYRYYKGELRTLYDNITVSNAMCFAPDGAWAYFSDTLTGQIMRVRLAEKDGWPVGEAEVFADLRGEGLRPDGSVVLSDGSLLNAQYGAGRVARYGADGVFIEAWDFPASQTTCPAMGAGTLYVTSAWQTMSDAARAAEPAAGQTFAANIGLEGLPENRIEL